MIDNEGNDRIYCCGDKKCGDCQAEEDCGRLYRLSILSVASTTINEDNVKMTYTVLETHRVIRA